MPMGELVRERCRNHPRREAVARCPECGGFYCRECVTDHRGRVICAPCLKRASDLPDTGVWGRIGSTVVSVSLLIGGLLAGWATFGILGRILLSIPTSFHEGTVWEGLFRDP